MNAMQKVKNPVKADTRATDIAPSVALVYHHLLSPPSPPIHLRPTRGSRIYAPPRLPPQKGKHIE